MARVSPAALSAMWSLGRRVGTSAEWLTRARSAGSSPARMARWLRPSGQSGVTGHSGAPEAGDQFGEVLSPAFHDLIEKWRTDPPIVEVGVLVGVPHEDIGRAKNAGMVARLNITDRTRKWHLRQGARGMSGRPETGDRFGASLAMHTPNLTFVDNGGLAIGAPGEDIGGVRDAGAVSLAYFEDSGPRPWQE